MIVKVLRENTSAAEDDTTDGFGGIPGGFIFPIFDPPGGCHLDDMLIDRMPAGEQEAAVHGVERTTASVRRTNYPARQHSVLPDPIHALTGWHKEQELHINT
jgi:hypothetical protein